VLPAAPTTQAPVTLTPGALTNQDKAEIQALSVTYRNTLFACKGEAYADLFATPGGYFASAPRGEIRERQALIEMVVGYDRCKANAGPSAEASPTGPAPAPPVVEAAPEGARARIVNSRGGGYYDDVYVKTPTGWKFRSRTVVSDDELAAGLHTHDFIEIRALSGDDHGYYEDLYGQPNGEIKPRGLGKPGETFRTSGLRITVNTDGVHGLAYLRNNGGHYEDEYVKTPEGWRIKDRKYFKP
jgi:hypothetical protein